MLFHCIRQHTHMSTRQRKGSNTHLHSSMVHYSYMDLNINKQQHLEPPDLNPGPIDIHANVFLLDYDMIMQYMYIFDI